MNVACPHIIAKCNNSVVGYALCMTPGFGTYVEVLKPMFNILNEIMAVKNYIIMGQVCIAKTHRKKGVFRALYQTMQSELKGEFKSVITEIDARNLRSLNAHEAIGFKTIKTYIANGKTWQIVQLLM